MAVKMGRKRVAYLALAYPFSSALTDENGVRFMCALQRNPEITHMLNNPDLMRQVGPTDADSLWNPCLMLYSHTGLVLIISHMRVRYCCCCGLQLLDLIVIPHEEIVDQFLALLMGTNWLCGLWSSGHFVVGCLFPVSHCIWCVNESKSS